MKNDVPRYVTAVSRSDVADGWCEHREAGRVVIDIERNAVVPEGLSMPHSPRLYRGRLWLDSGNGQFGYVDLERERFEPIALYPGARLHRGLCGGGSLPAAAEQDLRRA